MPLTQFSIIENHTLNLRQEVLEKTACFGAVTVEQTLFQKSRPLVFWAQKKKYLLNI